MQHALGLVYFQSKTTTSKEIFEDFREFKETAKSLKDASFRKPVNLGNFARLYRSIKNIIRMYNQNRTRPEAEYEIVDCYYQMGNEKRHGGDSRLLRSKCPDLNARSYVWLVNTITGTMI